MTANGKFADAVRNPKRHADAGGAQESPLFPYYAGYSAAFAGSLLASLNLPRHSTILDPWNGSGVTTSTARRFGYEAIGRDLNPAMVVISRAEQTDPQYVGRLLPLARRIVANAHHRRPHPSDAEPLAEWIMPHTARVIRSIETEIRQTLVGRRSSSRRALSSRDVDNLSPLAAVYYVALFALTRKLLARFRPTNPMWIKKPRKPYLRAKADSHQIVDHFLAEVRAFSGLLAVHSFTSPLPTRRSLAVGNSEQLDVKSRSVDLVLTSPPYCTRIDYAQATAVELAVLGFRPLEFDHLRRSLMGTSTVSLGNHFVDPLWGQTCVRFLKRLYKHASKASQTYYFKNHVQYFASLFKSLHEISRVLKPRGQCVIVVQDSYYSKRTWSA
jgi:DNA modification methylase